ncbi:hypothetical protein PMPD1_2629 [Paramixta manurensis]|uniref:Uncharacterized protein n=1 Tax=Paramixta manurensis TaxID=2740817 RepID=A0A6M8UIJ3_9GAMM|nr:hypothetical protein PMPD1_2629 [Erwiniaceae bacterium PD-1]
MIVLFTKLNVVSMRAPYHSAAKENIYFTHKNQFCDLTRELILINDTGCRNQLIGIPVKKMRY